jgi:hypothetical protein
MELGIQPQEAQEAQKAGDDHGWTEVSEFEVELAKALEPLLKRFGIELPDAEWNGVCAILGHHLRGGGVAYSGLLTWLKRIGTHSDFAWRTRPRGGNASVGLATRGK